MVGEHFGAGGGEVSVLRYGSRSREECQEEADEFAAGKLIAVGEGEQGGKGGDRAEDGKVRGAEHAQSGWHGFK